MKLTRRDILVLLYIGAVVLSVAIYNFMASPKMEEVDTVNSECIELEKKVSLLEEKLTHKGELEKQITDMEGDIADIVANYPVAISKEDIIHYVEELNENVDMNVSSVSFSEPATIYTVIGDGQASKYNMKLDEISVNVDYTTDYEGFKRIINYINEDPEHREITNISVGIMEITPEEAESMEEGSEETLQAITGTMNLVLYCIDGKIVEGDVVDRYQPEEVQHGNTNIYNGN